MDRTPALTPTQRVDTQVMSMLKQLDIDLNVVCMPSDTAAVVVEHHTSDCIGWLRCGCHKTEHTVQKIDLLPTLRYLSPPSRSLSCACTSLHTLRKHLGENREFVRYTSRVADVGLYIVAVSLVQTVRFIRHSHHPAE